MENEKYNGWTNYETWLIAMYWVDYLGNARREEQKDTGESIRWSEEQIKDIIWEHEVEVSGINENSPTVAQSLFSNAWRIINWQEIADHVNED